ncbi:hypothetical protein ACJX0J_016130, partial [Zea mays]
RNTSLIQRVLLQKNYESFLFPFSISKKHHIVIDIILLQESISLLEMNLFLHDQILPPEIRIKGFYYSDLVGLYDTLLMVVRLKWIVFYFLNTHFMFFIAAL